MSLLNRGLYFLKRIYNQGASSEKRECVCVCVCVLCVCVCVCVYVNAYVQLVCVVDTHVDGSKNNIIKELRLGTVEP